MNYIFKVTDKKGREIRLTREQWSHIRRRHPEISNIGEIKETLINPTKMTAYSLNENVRYYYKFFKYRKSKLKYLLVVVKYLNSEGFVITAYFEKDIK